MLVVSLFDESGNMLRPWARHGHTCVAIDILNEDGHVDEDGILYLNRDLTDGTALDDLVPDILFGFPPCTDLAISGAAHFKRKAEADPLFQEKATALARVVEQHGERFQVPWFAENPISVLSTKWRKPDHKFHPHEYGGYLPENDVHPEWPKYFPPRDAYPKKTCLWSGGGFVMPEKRPVPVDDGYSAQYRLLGGKSLRTKRIRSQTPRGFAEAVFQANAR